ncbi:hypothetical protein [Piscinibacter sp.]|uniref:hypothetical protein n=1 Tax=Piscinibacter sp. TaxID=1903157 RepID=UPI002C43EE54|nr:hypothetical protein [Albitalea sp.]HUG24762.1 hypothetical protein [Albitalea sp.]
MLPKSDTDRSTDRPSRDRTDHANLDPRRQVKHPKSAGARVPPSDRRGRASRHG